MPATITPTRPRDICHIYNRSGRPATKRSIVLETAEKRAAATGMLAVCTIHLVWSRRFVLSQVQLGTSKIV